MPGTFKLDQLQPNRPILFWKFSYFSTFILGSHFLLPQKQRANNQEREFSQLQNWMRQRGFSAWSIQNGPFAALLAHFVPKDFQLFHFHSGRPILITPEGKYAEKGILPTPKLDETEGFQCLGHSNWTICSPLSPFCFRRFSTFSPSYWEANSYYPEG